MNDDTLKALIGVAGAVTGAIASTATKSYLEKHDLFATRIKKRYALNGRWRGKAIQSDNNISQNVYDIELSLESSNSKISGEARVEYYNETMLLTISGGFKDEGFLKLDYENKDNSILQFGSFILKLSPDARKLDGRFVGFGHISRSITHGTIEFIKQ